MHTFYKEPNQDNFFRILPIDWKSEISNIWSLYANKANIYLLYDDDQVRAGGIVFSVCPPDMLYDPWEAQKWFDAGYLYIGFVWVIEEFRSQKLGSKWLQLLQDKYPDQKYWLVIEDEELKHFYMKNGFRMVKPLRNREDTEWLLVYEP